MSIFKKGLAFCIWAILAIIVPSATFGYDLQERANNSYDGTMLELYKPTMARKMPRK